MNDISEYISNGLKFILYMMSKLIHFHDNDK